MNYSVQRLTTKLDYIHSKPHSHKGDKVGMFSS